jgi:hypothetical protein
VSKNKAEEFRPSPVRWFFYHWAIACLFGAIGLLLVEMIFHTQRVVPFSIGIVIGITILTLLFSRNIRHWRIIITKQYIEGPGKNLRPVRIPLSEVDGKRSFRRTGAARLVGYDYIWSSDGRKIRIESLTFDQRQIDALKARLGITSRMDTDKQPADDTR